MFYKPFPKQVWEHADWLFESRVDKLTGQRLSLALLEGWGVCVELFADGVPCTLFVDEASMQRALESLFMHPGLMSCTARELQTIMPLLLAPMGSLLGDKVAWLACHLHHLEAPQWGLRFDWPETVENELIAGLQIFALDCPLDFLKPLVQGWEPEPKVQNLEDWKAPFAIELARMTMLSSAFQALKCGELLRFSDSIPLEEGAAWLTYGERWGKVTCQSRATPPKLQWQQSLQPEEKQFMSLCAPSHEPQVVVMASVGQVQLPLEKLRTLSQGEVIESAVQLYPYVQLLVNGLPFGKGELFWLGSEWAVRLLEKIDAQPPLSASEKVEEVHSEL